MRKHNFLTLLLITGYLFISMPVLHAQQFKGGIVGGINACQVDGDMLAGYNKLGFMAGAYVYRPVSNYFDFQLEIKYMGKGANMKKTQLSNTEYRNNNLHYIEIPVLVRCNIQKFGIEGGLGFGYLFASVIKDNFGEIELEEDEKMKPFEWSGLVGLNYKVKPNLSINLRYSYSILSIRNNYRTFFNNIISTGLYYEIGK